MASFYNNPSNPSGFYGNNNNNSNNNNNNNNNNNSNPYPPQPQQQSQHQPQQFYPSQQPQPQQQQSQPQQPQPQTTTAPIPAFWNPATASTVLNAATSGKGLSDDAVIGLASSAFEYSLSHGAGTVTPFVGRLMSYLRVYFAVDNRYVKTKIQRILVPYFYKSWKRLEIDPSVTNPRRAVAAPGSNNSMSHISMNDNANNANGGAGTVPPVRYAVPIHDDNAPDLYIPVMSLISYVLLCAICYGTAGTFTPEILPQVTTRCLLTQSLEVTAIKLGLYLMTVTTLSIGDLYAVTGYKYNGLCLNLLVGMTGAGKRGYWITLGYTGLSMSYFLLKFLANNVPKETNRQGPKRELVVVGCAASQFATMWFLSQTKFLS